MALSFGTDGVRGDAERELDDDFLVALGAAAAGVLATDRFVVGRDTRASGARIEAALARGLAAGGAAVDLVGVIPTPGVAYLAADEGVAGAVISASHNPWTDNGVKLFAPGGRKLSDATEAALEERLAQERPPPDPGSSDQVRVDLDAVDRYRAHLVASASARLDGLRVLLDCANGAASELAPQVFEQLGASVEVRNAEPDGRNINLDCGATHPEGIARLMPDRAFDLGLAFDGDADRVIAVDERGEIVDGDQLIGMCAIDRRDRGELPGNTVVVTVMSNLGFRKGMAATGIRVVETPVGDRHVLEALDRGSWTLGGEQSGHVIFRDLATTGDGILTGLQVCSLLMRTGRYLSDLATTAMTRFPQVLRNVAVRGDAAGVVERMADAIAAEERTLGDRGRVLVRPSGTEPLVRVMVEASTPDDAQQAVDRLVAAAEAAAQP